MLTMRAWLAAMNDVLNVQAESDIPELNEYQCGTYKMHSLKEAQEIAQTVLNRKVGINSNDELYLSDEFLEQ